VQSGDNAVHRDAFRQIEQAASARTERRTRTDCFICSSRCARRTRTDGGARSGQAA
jgi:hypothetical protein